MYVYQIWMCKKRNVCGQSLKNVTVITRNVMFIETLKKPDMKCKKKLEVYKCPEKEKPDCSSGYDEDFAMFMYTRTFHESSLAQLGRDV